VRVLFELRLGISAPAELFANHEDKDDESQRCEGRRLQGSRPPKNAATTATRKESGTGSPSASSYQTRRTRQILNLLQYSRT
jgi:hypothetical protein